MIRKKIAVALLGAMGAFGMMQPAFPITTREQQAFHQASRRQINLMRSQRSTWAYPAKDGHSVAHGKRLAKDRRNQRRHRNAIKGK